LTSESPNLERFLIDTDVDPELNVLLRKLGFRSRLVLTLKIPNDDTQLLIWARKQGYILVCHDKHRDAKTKHAFFSEMYYRGGWVIRISGEPGQPALWALGKILVHRPTWQKHFAENSGVAVVHPSGCNFTSANTLYERTRYSLRLPFDDPAIPLLERQPLPKRQRKPRTQDPKQLGLGV